MPFTLIQWLFTFEEESNFGDGMPLWIHLKLFGEGEGEGGGGLNRSKKVITKYVRDGFVDGTELKVFSPSISPKKKGTEGVFRPGLGPAKTIVEVH